MDEFDVLQDQLDPSPLTLADFRARILADWKPRCRNPESPDQLALDVAWIELQAVEKVGAWSSVIVQTGRIMERALSLALKSGHFQSPGFPNSKSLSRMLEQAQLHLLPRNTASGASSIAGDNFRLLRNMSAHFSELSPSELAATQALAILLVFIEALLPDQLENRDWIVIPKKASDEEFLDQWRVISPNVLARWVIHADNENIQLLFESDPEEVPARLLQATSSRAITRIPARLSAVPQYRLTYGWMLHQNLVHVLSRLSKGASGNWRRFVEALPALGLSAHHKVLTALLPYDSSWLIASLESGSSPYRVARTIIIMKRADHQQWRRLGATADECHKIAQAAWRKWPEMPTYSFAANRFMIAIRVKLRLGQEIAQCAPQEALTCYFEQVRDMGLLVRIGGLALSSSPFPRADRDIVWTTLYRRVKEVDLRAVRNTPLVIHLIGFSTGFMGEEILRCCITKQAHGLDDRRMLSKMLLIVWLTSNPLRSTAAERARTLAREGRADWVTLVCAGLLDISDSPPPGVVRKEFDEALLELHVPPDATKDELALALLGIIRLKPTAKPLLELIYRRFAEAPNERDVTLPNHVTLDHRITLLEQMLDLRERH